MKLLLSVLLSTFSLLARAAGCPALNGLYWDVPGDKEMNRVMKIEVKNCSFFSLTECFVQKDGGLNCGTEMGGPLDGQYHCRDNGNCPAFFASASEIRTQFQRTQISRFPGHGDCRWNQYAFSPGKNGTLTETTPATCTDGFQGNLSRTIERFR